MNLGLNGKSVVITGASRGIGRLMAESFANEGAHVAIAARNPEQVAQAVKEIEAKGVKAFGKAVDISDGAAIKEFVKEAALALGGIDIMISNASALLLDNSEEAWKAMFNVDVMGAVNTFDAAQPYLEKAAEKNGDAVFLITSSISSAEADSPSAYGAMKAAQVHFAKGIAKAWAGKRVRCNVISPGTVYFNGGFWDNIKKEAPEVYEQVLGLNPMGRMADPEEIANAALFLASPRSGFTTGANLVIDGGLSQRVNY